jgi:hypothetical protein
MMKGDESLSLNSGRLSTQPDEDEKEDEWVSDENTENTLTKSLTLRKN